MPFLPIQPGQPFLLPAFPEKIVSLVPSLTELLFDLGLGQRIAGITKFCVHPAGDCREKIRIGGTKQLNTGTILQLSPDLIIASKEENVKEQVEELAKTCPVWVTDVHDLPSALQMIRDMGQLTGKKSEAACMIRDIHTAFSGYRRPRKMPRAVYLIWREPYMTVGGDTFIHAMMQEAGIENGTGEKHRYPEILIKEIKELQCEWLLLSSEPYPFREQHVAEISAMLPGTRVIRVDGEMFSWYGSRLRYAPGYFEQLMKETGLYL